jgi:Zn-dependent M32 family carboxypeptidase
MLEVEKGRLNEIITWLTNNIYNYGSSEKPDKIISQAINKEVSDLPLINYLKNKFDNIYN